MFHKTKFIISLHHAPEQSKPSLALVFAILAIAAPFHVDPNVRALTPRYYERARLGVEEALPGGLTASKRNGERDGDDHKITLEIVQACCLLTIIDFGNAHHQVRPDAFC